MTGLSGAGKSSLVFEALHAEGQRRYVETFSAYTRQFLELLGKPRVDSIENIRPSIAIEQTNTVRSSRSTVGTMTELTDFFKVWFSHVAECFDPETGEKVEDDNPQSVWRKILAARPGAQVLVAFEVRRPANLAWPEILLNLKNQAYVRVLAAGPGDAGLAVRRVEELLADPAPLQGAERVFVVQDRVRVEPSSMARFTEAAETAMHFGRGEVRVFDSGSLAELGHYSRGLHSPKTGRKFRPATPPLFSFNSPLGACPRVPGIRARDRDRLPPRDPGPVALHRPGSDPVLGGGGVQLLEGRPAELHEEAGSPDRRPLREPHRRAAGLRGRRRARATARRARSGPGTGTA